MENKRKLLILYHSGAGSTKTIAEIYYKKLASHSIDITSIDLEYDYKKLMTYEFLIFAFPTYHCSPSHSMMEFIKNMPVFDEPKKAFVFTTCGLYSGNALREFIKKCSSKNLNINGYSVYRAPATDGALLLPSIPFMFNYEKNIDYKINTDIKKIEMIIKNDIDELKCPPFKLYTILNYPNKVLGKAFKHKLRLLKEYCINCNKCANDCIRKCWSVIGEYPHHEMEKCEFCFRCVHHCPNGAIILSKKTRRKLKLDEKFYENLKEKITQKAL
ncbi:EFR1 family ferrodoxin [Wukongibacter baidiensis]|uniref:EFR1 family ferrodoxin n=1 Tax=Wukongibacter baidiensis TaxID=1723361 RepID=UPI003D7F83A3